MAGRETVRPAVRTDFEPAGGRIHVEFDGKEVIETAVADFGGRTALAEHKEVPVVVASQLDGGSAGEDVSGSIILVERGGYTFVEKAVNAQTAGAVAIIIYNDESAGVPMEMGGSCEEIDSDGTPHETLMESITIPVLSIGHADGIRV